MRLRRGGLGARVCMVSQPLHCLLQCVVMGIAGAMRMQVDSQIAPIPLSERQGTSRTTADPAGDTATDVSSRENKWRPAFRMRNLASMIAPDRSQPASARASMDQAIETEASPPGRWPSDDLLRQCGEAELGYTHDCCSCRCIHDLEYQFDMWCGDLQFAYAGIIKLYCTSVCIHYQKLSGTHLAFRLEVEVD